MHDKGCLNKNYTKEQLEARLNTNGYKQIIDLAADYSTDSASCCELSHRFSFAYRYLAEKYSSCDFISDDSFEAMLEYHTSVIDKHTIQVYHNCFSPAGLLPGREECYDAVFSFMGLSFDAFINLFEKIMTLLKIGGIFVYQLPAYWYLTEGKNELEKQIISYSKQNEKKWLFVNPLEEIVKEHNGELLLLDKTGLDLPITRIQLARLSSLEKLYKAEQENNKAHLEICGLPLEMQLPTAAVVIRKKEKILTKDNIFNF